MLSRAKVGIDLLLNVLGETKVGVDLNLLCSCLSTSSKFLQKALQQKGYMLMAMENFSTKRGKKKIKTSKPSKGDNLKDGSSGNALGELNEIGPAQITAKKVLDSSKSLETLIRKKIDPVTAQYFSQIRDRLEDNTIDLEDRPIFCAKALKATRGIEVELATDLIMSHTIETLLNGCELDPLCEFLRNCAEAFPSIALDKCGSHVVETALKSLSLHVHDEESHSIIGDTLTKICQVVARNSINLMSSTYGSHVLRTLLCLCKGVPFDLLDQFHVSKPSVVLAERLNSDSTQQIGKYHENSQHGFESVFKIFIMEILNHAKDEMKNLMYDKCSSFVWQTALKLLVGDDQMLSDAILILLQCHEKNMTEDKYLKVAMKQNVLSLLQDTSSSHLLEVIVGVAPDVLYDKLLNEVFKGSLYKISLQRCGNFVVQALISSSRSSDQVDVMWDEIGPKTRELLNSEKAGVIAVLLAACQRLQVHAQECCEALASAVSSGHESSSCIFPRILFLEGYFRKRSSWEWPMGEKMNTLGCLMLQIMFRFPKDFIRPFIDSLKSMEANYIIETAKDDGGCRVLEAFLSSDASAKEKCEVIAKLQGYFGELSMHRGSSFTVEKCFHASNINLKEAIAKELQNIQAELSKSKHGPHLLRNLEIDEFAKRPAQWKAQQATKERVHRDFQAIFGSNTTKHQKQDSSPHQPPQSSKKKQKRHEQINAGTLQEDTESNATSSKHGFPGDKRLEKSRNFVARPAKEHANSGTSFMMNSKKRKSTTSELADLACKKSLSQSDVQKLFKSSAPQKGKHSESEKTPFLSKKQKK
ncbi:hypothetical protein J5N97_005811 [Dioscorea zingiberensis]|uniref:Uncharacterized protein n=1 Tax=Dioscorea zingiberensis TaxID=325984 RepID=A0A9D5D8U2_9LILI|nr:hypothetical protein J5N97_005811 [Dioscorea zingiberensis]